MDARCIEKQRRMAPESGEDADMVAGGNATGDARGSASANAPAVAPVDTDAALDAARDAALNAGEDEEDATDLGPEPVLTPRREAFARAIAAGQTAAAAARHAGYAPAGAGQQGHRLLKNVEVCRRIGALRRQRAAAEREQIGRLLGHLDWALDSARKLGEYGAVIRAVEAITRLKRLSAADAPWRADLALPEAIAPPDPYARRAAGPAAGADDGGAADAATGEAGNDHAGSGGPGPLPADAG